MKIIKANIKKHRTLSETSFQYPNGWDSNKINVLAYEDTENLGDVIEYCIGLVHDDEYAKTLIGSENVPSPHQHPEAGLMVIEIDEATANELGDKWKPQTFVVDNDKLPNILVALNKSKSERTKEEDAMLDPDNPTNGIRKSPKFAIRNWFPE